MGYEDAKHRPHARFTGEEPKNIIAEAPYHLSVTLDCWGPRVNCFPTMYDMLQSNWGDAPSRTMRGRKPATGDYYGWTALSPEEQQYIDSCFAGKTLPQVLEMFTFAFLVDGCTRACTHQLVRTRIGAAYMQHGGRDNDWRHRPWVMPETIRRACQFDDQKQSDSVPSMGNLKHCITNWDAIEEAIGNDEVHAIQTGHSRSLRTAIEAYLKRGRELYAGLVDAGIPWEDARRLLWMGTGTYIHIIYNYQALRGMLANRLEHIMDWEINCVAQLMLRELNMYCPPIFTKYLGSHSDRQQQEAFAGLQSWTPVGKYDNPYEKCICGHAKANHTLDEQGACEVCWRGSGGHFSTQPECRSYRPADSLPREHRPEQNPFWILSPESMAGGPVRWIPTNGVYPESLRPRP